MSTLYKQASLHILLRMNRLEVLVLKRTRSHLLTSSERSIDCIASHIIFQFRSHKCCSFPRFHVQKLWHREIAELVIVEGSLSNKTLISTFKWNLKFIRIWTIFDFISCVRTEEGSPEPTQNLPGGPIQLDTCASFEFIGGDSPHSCAPANQRLR